MYLLLAPIFLPEIGRLDTVSASASLPIGTPVPWISLPEASKLTYT